MAVRQIQVLCCDYCGVEAVHSASTTTDGWIAISPVKAIVYHESNVGRELGGHFCSVTCVAARVRDVLTGPNGGNLIPPVVADEEDG